MAHCQKEMEDFAHIVLFITTASAEEARHISGVLLNKRKTACVNIIPEVSSHFWWQDKLDSTPESLLVVKTNLSQLNEIIRLVKELHSYDVPEIIALPIVGGNQDYLEWIDKEVK